MEVTITNYFSKSLTSLKTPIVLLGPGRTFNLKSKIFPDQIRLDLNGYGLSGFRSGRSELTPLIAGYRNLIEAICFDVLLCYVHVFQF